MSILNLFRKNKNKNNVDCNEKSNESKQSYNDSTTLSLECNSNSPHNIEVKNEINKVLNVSCNDTTNLYELEKQAREKSDALYDIHTNSINKFNPQNNILETDTKPLTSIEKSFLKYIIGENIYEPYIATYWTYEYNINYSYLISKFFNMDYLKISNYIEDLTKLTVSELKEILKSNNIKSTGKKAELIERIEKEISRKDLSNFFNSSNKYYALTDKGKELLKDVRKSVTKNTDLEDQCLELIYIDKYEEAYDLICKYESSKNIQRGININWENHKITPMKIESYKAIKELDINLKDTLLDNIIKSSYILCDMLGNNSKTSILVKRLAGEKIDNIEINNAINSINDVIYNHSTITYNANDSINNKNLHYMDIVKNNKSIPFEVNNKNYNFKINENEIYFFNILKIKMYENELKNNFVFDRMSDGAFNVFDTSDNFIGKVKLQGRKKWIMYMKNEFGSEHIYGELIHLIDGIDAWIKYSKEYLK
ncbi:SAP domain protein [Clostridioides difficile 824]|uniref:SAP domain-containing protein n=1 Tax=Clostridioides difficile TaxID=1496 RepID=UPI00038D0D0A|nr:SAP domain-containing protein [Clostridioides difficile]OFU44026.1 DNA-binding protein [Clostridium sp. HMSC19A11]EGT4721667.1 DNA-binding protein [Clostridioides difficile]EQE66329.1 SAP domain protein [Clostridioides difficile CD44]EQF93353.1 SAP domain protein [Clostridioides difficile 824]EZR29293.1 DNA-binding protein [Clostridioides difficile]